MKKQIIITIIAIAPILFMGCKKDKPATGPERQEEEFVTSLKSWFELKTLLQPGKKDIRMGTPEWSKTNHYPESGFSVTPIKLGNKNTMQSNSVYKLLVTWENQQGMIINGSYIYIIPDKGSVADVPGMITNHVKGLISLDKTPGNFNGTVIKYDLDYNKPVSKHYENGQTINRNEKIIAGKRDNYQDMNSAELNSVVLACGECEDYYLITYDEQGHIISIEYLYTECGDCTGPGGGGGGGNNGGNNPSPCEMTQQQMQTALAAMTCITTNGGWGIMGQPSPPDQNGIIRAPKNCKGGGFTLNIIAGYAPHWSSTYSGVVYKINQNDPWKWESLTYTGFPQTGGTLPPCVSATATATSSVIITPDKSKALTTGLYNCSAYWTCITSVGIRTFSGPFGADFDANLPYEE